MLSKNQEKEDPSNHVDEESKQLQGETQSGSPNRSSAITGIITAIFVIIITSFFEIENISPQPKLLAWSSDMNKIDVVELETKQEFANFDGVNLKRYSIFRHYHF